MLKKIIFPIMLFITLFLSYGDSFQKANEEFSKKNYKQAEMLYLKDLEKNKNDVNTLFNLANVYLNLNMEGKALYTFYKASLINPYDESIKKEIFTLEEDLDLLEQNPYPLVLSYKHNWYLTLTIILIVSLIFFILTLFNYKEKRDNILYRIKKPLLIILALILLVSVTGNILYYKDFNSGIVLDKSEVLISPYNDSDISFTINEGSKIKVEDTFKNYLFITDKKGRYGWIINENLGPLWK